MIFWPILVVVIIIIIIIIIIIKGRLHGLTVACWITDHYHPCSYLGVGISERCFIFEFADVEVMWVA